MYLIKKIFNLNYNKLLIIFEYYCIEYYCIQEYFLLELNKNFLLIKEKYLFNFNKKYF